MKTIKEYLPKASAIIAALIVKQIVLILEAFGLFDKTHWIMKNVPLQIFLDIASICLLIYGIYGVLKIKFKQEIALSEKARAEFKASFEVLSEMGRKQAETTKLIREVLIKTGDKEKLIKAFSEYSRFDMEYLKKLVGDNDMLKSAYDARAAEEIDIAEINNASEADRLRVARERLDNSKNAQ